MTKLRDQTSRQILIFQKSQNYPPNWQSLPMPQNPNWQGQGNVKQRRHKEEVVCCPFSVWGWGITTGISARGPYGTALHGTALHAALGHHLMRDGPQTLLDSPFQCCGHCPREGCCALQLRTGSSLALPAPHLLPADLSPLGHSLRSAFLPALLYLIPRILCRSAVWAAQLCQLLDVASSPPSPTVHTRKYLQDAQPSAHPQGQREGSFQGD